jgi:hypothetical protein
MDGLMTDRMRMRRRMRMIAEEAGEGELRA